MAPVDGTLYGDTGSVAHCASITVLRGCMDTVHMLSGCDHAVGRCAVVALCIVVGIGLVLGFVDWALDAFRR